MELLLSLALLLPPQAGPPGLDRLDPEVLSSSEQSRLLRETNVDRRIKIYEAVSTRYLRSVRGWITRDESQSLDREMELWLRLLAFSLEDIEKNVPRKKKSRSLIHYEIQLRKAIADMKDMRFKVVAEAQGGFDAWLNEAESIRNKFVDILFPR